MEADFSSLEYSLKCRGECYGKYPHAKIHGPEIIRFQQLFRLCMMKHWGQRAETPRLGETYQNHLVLNYNSLPSADLDINTGCNLLSKLVVVKVVKEQLHDSDFLLFAAIHLAPIINQLKVLNKQYHSEACLVLIGNFYNKGHINVICKRYSDDNLRIMPSYQQLFPSADQRVIPQELKCKYKLTGTEVGCGRPEAWYVPGDADALFNLFGTPANHLSGMLKSVREKEFALVLNSSNSPEMMDLRILKYIDASELNIILEVVDINKIYAHHQRDAQFVVSENNNFKLVKHELEERTGLRMVNSNNVWIRTNILARGSSFVENTVVPKFKEINEAVCCVELDASASYAIQHYDNVAAVKVPLRQAYPARVEKSSRPSCSRKYKLKALGHFALCYGLYHGAIIGISGLLEPNCDEVALTWIESAIWFALLCVYMMVVLHQRFKSADCPQRPTDRRMQARVETFHVLLLAFTRFIYVGLAKTSSKNRWFGNNHWKYLGLAHMVSFILELIGSYAIAYFVGVGVHEPMEFG